MWWSMEGSFNWANKSACPVRRYIQIQREKPWNALHNGQNVGPMRSGFQDDRYAGREKSHGMHCCWGMESAQKSIIGQGTVNRAGQGRANPGSCRASPGASPGPESPDCPGSACSLVQQKKCMEAPLEVHSHLVLGNLVLSPLTPC
jgi:hypothetical protein